MVATLERRVARLESSMGSGGCERCRDTLIVIGSGRGDISVNRRGVRLTPEASRRFYNDEQPDGRCPQCDRQRERIRVGWSLESKRR